MTRYATVYHTPGSHTLHLDTFADGALGHIDTLCGRRYRYVLQTGIDAAEASAATTCPQCRAAIDLDDYAATRALDREPVQDADMFDAPADELPDESMTIALCGLFDAGVLTADEFSHGLRRLNEGCDASEALAHSLRLAASWAYIAGCDASEALGNALSGAAWLALCARLDGLAVAEHIISAVGTIARLVNRYGTHGTLTAASQSFTAVSGLDLTVWGADPAMPIRGREYAVTSPGAYAEAMGLHAEGIRADTRSAVAYWPAVCPLSQTYTALADAAREWDAMSAAHSAAVAAVA